MLLAAFENFPYLCSIPQRNVRDYCHIPYFLLSESVMGNKYKSKWRASLVWMLIRTHTRFNGYTKILSLGFKYLLPKWKLNLSIKHTIVHISRPLSFWNGVRRGSDKTSEKCDFLLFKHSNCLFDVTYLQFTKKIIEL